jgi:hypothetical protein
MINQGYFLITDISGYTQFLTESELVHANEIINSLFTTQLKNIKSPFRISSYQGDAIQTYGLDDEIVRPQMIFEMVEAIYIEFKNHVLQSDYNTTCQCNACSNIKLLDLKIFIHHGEFLIHEIGGRSELQGKDVIIAHRLMKNSVKEKHGIEGYALFTDAAVKKSGIQEMSKLMIAHTEEYEHVGSIDLFVYNLETVWENHQNRNKVTVSKDDNCAYGSIEIPVPKSVLWDYLVDPEIKRTYSELISVTTSNLQDGRISEGAKYHCVHESSDFEYEILDWSPFDYFTAREKSFGLTYQ